MLAASLAKTVVWKVLAYGAAAYLLVCFLVYFGQRKLIYAPSKNPKALPPRFEEWRSSKGDFWGYKRVAGSKACLFFFHGNGGNASGWAHAADAFPADIFVLEYPGYGSRAGSPTEESLKAAALQAFESEQGKYEQVVVAGQSLGTGITQAIFSKHPERVSKLVLITPFTSIAEVARAHFAWLPTGWILRDRFELFESWKNFPGESCLVIAGQDEVIPGNQARLYLQCKSDRCEVLELPRESHNTIRLTREFWERALED